MTKTVEQSDQPEKIHKMKLLLRARTAVSVETKAAYRRIDELVNRYEDMFFNYNLK